MEFLDINYALNSIILTFLVIISVAIAKSRHLFEGVILLSLFSLLMAAIYLVLGAPDVAITEAAIGAGISTFLFLGALLLVGDQEKAYTPPVSALLVVILTGVALIYGTLGLPAFGDIDAVTNTHLITEYLNNSYDKMGIPNVVTSVLASYRGFDTLGETFVVFTAAMSVWLILRPDDESDDDAQA